MAANDSRQSSPRHRAAGELAKLLDTPEGARTARLLQQLGTFADEPSVAIAEVQPEPPKSAPRPIGIWQPRQLDGELIFERPPLSPLGDHHASIHQLRATKPAGCRRLGWFGESAAAGYLYAPHWTPAQLIEGQLAHRADQPWQVIDLARTNERLAPMIERIDAARQLDLDLWVIYAGNNWPLLEMPETSAYHSGIRSRQRWAAAWRRHGPSGPRRQAQQQLEQRILSALDQLKRLADGTPVLWVVPEVNLADWQTAQPPTWLAGDGATRWHRLYQDARQGLAAKDLDRILRAAKAMSDLDQGDNPTPYRLQAEAHLLAQRPVAARRAARAAIDRQSYANLAMLAAPQANSSVIELLRQTVTDRGWQLVDLPQIIERQDPQRLADRRLFLDYCHLQADGLRLLATAVVDEVLPGSAVAGPDHRARDETEDLPTAAVEATACLGAAVHSAHRLLSSGDKVASLRAWLEDALSADPGCEAAMLDLLEARISLPGEELLSAAQRRNLDSPYPLGLQHGWRWEHLDCDLLEAICQALEPRRANIRQWLANLLVEHHAADQHPRQLATAPYLWEPLAQLFPAAIGDSSALRLMLRSAWPTTRLCLIASGESPLALHSVARLAPTPGLDPDRRGSASWQLNGRPIGQQQLGCSWQKQALVVAPENLQRGLNCLTVLWPPLPPQGEAALEAALRRLEEGIEADLHPIFGELASLRAGPVARPPTHELGR